jgi:hypothetical protein
MTANREPEDFANLTEIGARLVDITRDVKKMDRLAPGAFGDWGVEIEGTVFEVRVTVRRPDERHPLAGATLQ